MPFNPPLLYPDALKGSRLLLSAWVVAALTVFAFRLPAQTAPAKTTSAASAPGTSSGGTGFSIESEMLTYRALQSNSEAVACDIAAYLYKVPPAFDKTSAGSKCSLKSTSGSPMGIVIMPLDQSVLDAYQLWRADIEVMTELRRRSDSYCGSTGKIQQGDKGASAAAIVGALTPAGSALTLAQGVLGSIASQTEVTPVTGTVQDQAFLDGVARQLSALGVAVIVPSVYAPNTLSGVDETTSPFLAALSKFLSTRDCVIEAASKDANDKVLAEISGEMNAFLASLGGNPTVTTKSPTANTGTNAASGSGSGTGITTPSPAQAQPTSPVAGIAAILLADGLAQKLGVDPSSGKMPATGQWQHILFLKALESGGSIVRTSNILGTRIRYSGGAVGTFTLLTRDGNLECSGNVFDFGGSVSAKHFERDLRSYTPDVSSQLVFQRGSCAIPIGLAH